MLSTTAYVALQRILKHIVYSEQISTMPCSMTKASTRANLVDAALLIFCFCFFQPNTRNSSAFFPRPTQHLMRYWDSFDKMVSHIRHDYLFIHLGSFGLTLRRSLAISNLLSQSIPSMPPSVKVAYRINCPKVRVRVLRGVIFFI